VVARVHSCRSPIDTSRTHIASVRPSVVAGVAVDGIGWWVVMLQYFMIERWLIALITTEVRKVQQ
jgi:hypothetical protein